MLIQAIIELLYDSDLPIAAVVLLCRRGSIRKIVFVVCNLICTLFDYF